MKVSALKYAAIIALFLVTACETATTENYDALLGSWVGQPERELLMSWGIPDRQYNIDANTKLIAYKSHHQVYYPGTYPQCYGGGRGRFRDCSAGVPPVVQYLSCETTFTSVSGRITRWQHAGNDCVR